MIEDRLEEFKLKACAKRLVNRGEVRADAFLLDTLVECNENQFTKQKKLKHTETSA